MTKLTKNAGFTIVEVLLVLILIAIVAFAGYYVWHSQKKPSISDKPASTSQKSSNSTSHSAASKFMAYTLPVERLTFGYDPSVWTLGNKTEDQNDCGKIDSVTLKNGSFNMNIGINNVGCGKGGGECNDGDPANACEVENKLIKKVAVGTNKSYYVLAQKISADHKTWQYSVFLYDQTKCISQFCFLDSQTKDSYGQAELSQVGGGYGGPMKGSGGATSLNEYVKLPEVKAAIAVLETMHYQ
jgi:prepilin-type N-terminal cleavage/methylation domain-containing protein